MEERLNPVALKLELNRLLGPWLEQTLALQKFCEGHSLPFPPAEVQELFVLPSAVSKNGHSAGVAAPKRGRDKQPRAEYRLKPKPFNFTIPPMPDYGPCPDGAGPDWKAVPLKEASSLNLVLYILKEAGGAAPSSTINAKLAILRPSSGKSTSSMTLNSLKDEDKIAGDYRQWSLKGDVQIVISGERMWCAPDQLRQQDRAAVRREVILAALKVNQRMTVADISECLRRCEWLNGVTVEPDQVKGNMRFMNDEGIVEKEGVYWKLKA